MAWALIPVALALLGLFVSYSISPAIRARKRVQASLSVYENTLSELRSFHDTLRVGLSQVAQAYATEIRAERLKAISINEFKKHGQSIRLTALRDAGLTNLASLQGWTSGRLEAIRGIGPNSASQIASIVTSLTNETNAIPIPLPSALFITRPEETLLRSAYMIRHFESRTGLGQVRLEEGIGPIRQQTAKVARAASFATWIFGFGKGKRSLDAIEEAKKLSAVLNGDSEISKLQKELSSELSDLHALNVSQLEKLIMLSDFEENKKFYEDRLADLLGKTNKPIAPSTSFLCAPTIPVTIKADVITTPAAVPIPPRPVNAVNLRGLQATKLWTPAGTDVTVHGFTIKGGMVYVGTGLKAVSGGSPEPALIDPSLPVTAQGNCHERRTYYWPNYSSIDEAARASYLQWLGTGRSDPEADIGYVFLSLYGLERRLLLVEDPASDPEAPLLEAEISRLLGIYGQKSYSFNSYASSLLEFSYARRQSIDALTRIQEPVLQYPFTNSLAVKTTLGVFSKSGEPLPVNWALAWVLWAREIDTPAHLGKCLEPFSLLFREAYHRKFGEGMTLPASVTRIKVTHKQASASFAGMTFSLSIDLPDISVLTRPISALKGIATTCLEEIEPYRRFVSSHPERVSTLDALCLLPVQVWPEAAREEIKKIQSKIEESGGKPYVLPLTTFQSLFGGDTRLKTKQLESLSRQLAGVEIGIEPDVRFGAPLPKMNDLIALFPSEGLPRDNKLSDDFRGAESLVELAAAVVSCGKGVGDETTRFILNYVANKWGLLRPSELVRLSAQLSLYSIERPGNGPIRTFLDTDHLDPGTRDSVCEFLVMAMLADGIADPEEVKALEKIYQGLGLERTELYSRIHAASQAHASAATSPKPASQPLGAQSFQFDLKKIAALRADSTKVSELLGGVFAESDEDAAEVPAKVEETVQPAESALLELDSAHAALLNVLIQRAQWTRAEVEEICTDRSLMVDGALERINEAAFNQFDCAILEGNDPIDVSLELLKELPA